MEDSDNSAFYWPKACILSSSGWLLRRCCSAAAPADAVGVASVAGLLDSEQALGCHTGAAQLPIPQKPAFTELHTANTNRTNRCHWRLEHCTNFCCVEVLEGCALITAEGGN